MSKSDTESLVELLKDVLQERAEKPKEPKFLSKEESLKKIKDMPCMPEEYYEFLKECSFVTGTHAYAPNVVSDDIDMCTDLPPHVFDKYNVVSADGYMSPDGWSSSYAKSPPGQVINILSFSNYELLEAWRRTTDKMILMNAWNPGCFDQKWKRVRMFQAIRDCEYTEAKRAVKYNAETKQFDAVETDIELVTRRKCLKCGQKANFFYDKKGREIYNSTGICVRCQVRG